MKPSKKINNEPSGGEFFEGVKIIEEEPFRSEYNKIINKRNASKNNPTIAVTCLYCKRSAIETAEGYICPKCGHKSFKGISSCHGYFICICGLLVDNNSKKCQRCKSYNPRLPQKKSITYYEE